MAEVLREELLTVPGIAGAAIESDGGVAGVRVQLAEGADADAVGAAVRRILSSHGMRPVLADPEDLPPPEAAGSVVSFPLVGEHVRPDEPEMLIEAGLESVALEETPQGIAVAVRSSDGRRADRILEAGVAGMDDAVVAAVAQLLEHDRVELIALSEVVLGSETVVTVLLDSGRRQLTGAAVQHGGRPYAVAKATWIALSQSG